MIPHLRFSHFAGQRVHLGLTGSIAVFKVPELIRMLQQVDILSSVTLTGSAREFLTPLPFRALGSDPVFDTLFSDDPFAHLYPAQNAQAFVVVPATANIIAKMAHGIADDLLSTQILAFPKNTLVVPSMNHNMWHAKATLANWDILKARGFLCLEPESGKMACGTEGVGRLPSLEEIFAFTGKTLIEPALSSRSVLISLGPTREFFDPVRFVSNPSTGLMGASLAIAAWLQGAKVTVVKGPADVWLPRSIPAVEVTSAEEMHTACLDLWPEHDIGIMTAAVSDFAPVENKQHKVKKRTVKADTPSFAMKKTPDILAALSENKSKKQILVGFAAESKNLRENTLRKLQSKGCDIIVGNDITAEACGFGSFKNSVFIATRKGKEESWPALAKPDIAWKLIQLISESSS